MKKRTISLALALMMILSLAACGGGSSSPTATPAATETLEETATPAPETEAPDETESGGSDGETIIFTDSVGREVEVPRDISRIAPSGAFAQMYLFAIAPDYFVGLASDWSAEAAEFLDAAYLELPVLGQLYGTADLNLEELAAADPQIIIDVGEPKSTIVEDMDALSEQLGIPAVHITASLSDSGNAFRKLGELLGLEDEAEALAAYCESIYASTLELMENVGEDKVSLVYCLGDTGLNVLSEGSFHSEAINIMSNNAAVTENPSSKGTGDEIDIEQLLLWDPDVIMFAPGSIYETVADDAAWQELTAIKNGAYYEVPNGPYNWMGSPPSVNRYLGLIWAGSILYPDFAEYDLYEKVSEYYDLFYHCQITTEQFDALVN